MTREDIDNIINAVCPNDEDFEKPCISPKYLRQELEQLALDQRQWNGEPTTKNDLGVDLISRADALDCVNMGITFCDVYKKINELPSVTPKIEPRKGHWLMPDENYSPKIWRKCSCCSKHIEKFSKYVAFNGSVHYIENALFFCPLCGADMRESEVNT